MDLTVWKEVEGLPASDADPVSGELWQVSVAVVVNADQTPLDVYLVPDDDTGNAVTGLRGRAVYALVLDDYESNLRDGAAHALPTLPMAGRAEVRLAW